jgi:hypothetical protein
MGPYMQNPKKFFEKKQRTVPLRSAVLCMNIELKIDRQKFQKYDKKSC